MDLKWSLLKFCLFNFLRKFKKAWHQVLAPAPLGAVLTTYGAPPLSVVSVLNTEWCRLAGAATSVLAQSDGRAPIGGSTE